MIVSFINNIIVWFLFNIIKEHHRMNAQRLLEEQTILAMLTQPLVVAPVCAGTHNLHIVMITGMQRIKKTTAEIPMEKQLKGRGVTPQIPRRYGNIVIFHVW